MASGQLASWQLCYELPTYEMVAAQMPGSYTRIDAHPLRYNLGSVVHYWCSTAHGKAGEYRMRG